MRICSIVVQTLAPCNGQINCSWPSETKKSRFRIYCLSSIVGTDQTGNLWSTMDGLSRPNFYSRWHINAQQCVVDIPELTVISTRLIKMILSCRMNGNSPPGRSPRRDLTVCLHHLVLPVDPLYWEPLHQGAAGQDGAPLQKYSWQSAIYTASGHLQVDKCQIFLKILEGSSFLTSQVRTALAWGVKDEDPGEGEEDSADRQRQRGRRRGQGGGGGGGGGGDLGGEEEISCQALPQTSLPAQHRCWGSSKVIWSFNL